MKKVLLIVAAILLANAVSAQNYEKNILGVRAGLNLSSYSISAGGASISTDSRASFHVAVTDQILLCNKLGATDKPCGEGVRMLTQNCC